MSTITPTATSATFDVKSELKKRIMEELARKSTGAAMDKALAADVGAPIANAEPVKEEVEPELVLGANQVAASKLLKFRVKPDFAVDVLKSEDIPLQVRAFIPKEDPTYSVQKEEALQFLRALQSGDKVLVSGPTGSGKSSLVQYLCALTNRPMIRLNMSGDVESANIFGQLTAKDGATVWKDGAATEAVRYGAVLVNDEWDVTPPEIMFGYQWLMEDNGKLYLKEMPGSSEEKMITPHKDFRFVCLGNTLGQGDDSGKYAGTNVQNTATLDRFQTTITLGYLSATHEIKVLKNVVPELDEDLARKMVSVARLVRDGYTQGHLSLSVSPRTLINWGRKITQWKNPELAFNLAFANKLGEQERGAALALFKKSFG